MPYKDLERKRQWEREHREQRNAISHYHIIENGSKLAVQHEEQPMLFCCTISSLRRSQATELSLRTEGHWCRMLAPPPQFGTHCNHRVRSASKEKGFVC